MRKSYRYLVELIRKFPRPNVFADMIRAAGFRQVKFTPMTGGIVALHIGLALVIAALTHSLRLMRAGFVLAREGVFGLVDPAQLPAPRAVRLAHGAADRAARSRSRTRTACRPR